MLRCRPLVVSRPRYAHLFSPDDWSVARGQDCPTHARSRQRTDCASGQLPMPPAATISLNKVRRKLPREPAEDRRDRGKVLARCFAEALARSLQCYLDVLIHSSSFFLLAWPKKYAVVTVDGSSARQAHHGDVSKPEMPPIPFQIRSNC